MKPGNEAMNAGNRGSQGTEGACKQRESVNEAMKPPLLKHLGLMANSFMLQRQQTRTSN